MFKELLELNKLFYFNYSANMSNSLVSFTYIFTTGKIKVFIFKISNPKNSLKYVSIRKLKFKRSSKVLLMINPKPFL